MKVNDLRQKSKEELGLLLIQKRRYLADLRLLIWQKKLKDVREVPETKKDVARILTLMRETRV